MSSRLSMRGRPGSPGSTPPTLCGSPESSPAPSAALQSLEKPTVAWASSSPDVVVIDVPGKGVLRCLVVLEGYCEFTCTG
jgi:hypothetical protein